MSRRVSRLVKCPEELCWPGFVRKLRWMAASRPAPPSLGMQAGCSVPAASEAAGLRGTRPHQSLILELIWSGQGAAVTPGG